MDWSPQQSRALDAVAEWFKHPSSPQVFILNGYAGTGKTTLAKHFAQHVPGMVLFAAYTGKAASVLRQMGCPGASTLHSLMYSVGDPDRSGLIALEEQLMMVQDDPVQTKALKAEIKEMKRKLNQPRFSVNAMSPIHGASLVILDESSMIDEKLAKDLESFRVKLLIMGDTAQLPPVMGVGYYAKREPNAVLTEIHRQARDNPILHYATLAREGKEIPFGDLGQAKKIRKDDAPDEVYLDGAQLIIGTNKGRRKLNRFVRAQRGYDHAHPRKGEQLVILRNDYDRAVLNGTLAIAHQDAELVDGEMDALELPLVYDGRLIPDFIADSIPFDLYEAPESTHDDLIYAMNGPDRRWMVPVDYGYALTCHKAQGSQWPRVTVCDDSYVWKSSLTKRQWLYTAITRAQQEVVIVK